MALNVRKFPLHRRGRVLDRSRVLYVTRRIPSGGGAFLAPGGVFDATGIPDTRLKALFAGRFIGHEPPRVVDLPPAPAPGPTASSPAVVEPSPTPKPAKQPRSSARS